MVGYYAMYHVAWSIIQAQTAHEIDAVFLTQIQAYAEIGKFYG